MKRLFFRFYLGVLAVLFLAWYIHGVVLRARTDADRARVIAQCTGAVRASWRANLTVLRGKVELGYWSG